MMKKLIQRARAMLLFAAIVVAGVTFAACGKNETAKSEPAHSEKDGHDHSKEGHDHDHGAEGHKHVDGDEKK